MNVTWRLRMAAAQRDVWTGAELRRLLAERAGMEISAASVSALLTKPPAQLSFPDEATLRPDSDQEEIADVVRRAKGELEEWR